MGYRYRLYGKDLPGKPDVVFRSRKKVIFVHGCFWHFHDACREGRVPTSNTPYWEKKYQDNRARDTRVRSEMSLLGWESLVIWQCETKDVEALKKRLLEFLGPPRAGKSVNETANVAYTKK